jgi:hypothetical protein
VAFPHSGGLSPSLAHIERSTPRLLL